MRRRTNRLGGRAELTPALPDGLDPSLVGPGISWSGSQSMAPESPVPRWVDQQQVMPLHHGPEEPQVVGAARGGGVARAALDRHDGLQGRLGAVRVRGTARTRSSACPARPPRVQGHRHRAAEGLVVPPAQVGVRRAGAPSAPLGTSPTVLATIAIDSTAVPSARFIRDSLVGCGDPSRWTSVRIRGRTPAPAACRASQTRLGNATPGPARFARASRRDFPLLPSLCRSLA